MEGSSGQKSRRAHVFLAPLHEWKWEWILETHRIENACRLKNLTVNRSMPWIVIQFVTMGLFDWALEAQPT